MENKIDVLLGLQWGDEGKGKIVDFLSEKYDVIARFHGGANAGHTLKIANMTHVLHLIPSGIFHQEKINIIGSGVVLDPFILKEESDGLKNLNINCVKSVLISKSAHLILPSHRMLDAVYEQSKGSAKIGSTMKGIGPTYTDKVSRNGLRVGDILSDNFIDAYNALKEQHLRIAGMYGFDVKSFAIEKMPFEEYEKEWLQSIEFLKTFQLIDCSSTINRYLAEGKSVLAEGAQGTMLDIEYGTYPYVTSSNTITAGVCTGLGVSPHKIGRVFGIAKAYCTRVGEGPFPTELSDEVGEKLRLKGMEFGATTGRPRRCGWIDLAQLKYAVMINGVTNLIITKSDVLNSFSSVKACVAYKANGEVLEDFPFNLLTAEIEPQYKEFEGWCTDLPSAGGLDGLPSKFKDYMAFIEKFLEVKISVISVGPDRSETIFLS